MILASADGSHKNRVNFGFDLRGGQQPEYSGIRVIAFMGPGTPTWKPARAGSRGQGIRIQGYLLLGCYMECRVRISFWYKEPGDMAMPTKSHIRPVHNNVFNLT
jgi:hypothetical protein